MSYIDSALLPSETIVSKAKIHWFIYVSPAIITLIGVFLCTQSTEQKPIIGFIGGIFIIIGIVKLIKSWFYCYSTELAVTSKRVIAKYGFIRRNTIEIKHDKIESLNVNQSVMGRIFNFGSVYITGAGGSRAPIPYIVDPLKFKKAALEESDKSNTIVNH